MPKLIPLIVANWKMNPPTLVEAKQLFNSVKRGLQNLKNVEVVICPPFVFLPQLVDFFYRCRKSQLIKFGAQDCFWENLGAFTGETSPLMLKNLGCQYVILGHSERRKYFGETDEMINKKIKAALLAKLKPILCLGETEKERKEGKTFEILKKQLKKSLFLIPNSKFLILAYEPVWAIGTGKSCGIPEAKKANLFIRKTLHQLINSSTHQLLYGGSVNSQNARDYIKEAGFEGLLVGSASLNAKEFVKIIRQVVEP